MTNETRNNRKLPQITRVRHSFMFVASSRLYLENIEGRRVATPLRMTLAAVDVRLRHRPAHQTPSAVPRRGLTKTPAGQCRIARFY